MNIYHSWSPAHIWMRRLVVLAAGFIALPFMLFYPERSRYYSYLHRCWCKTSSQPVWLAQAELTGTDFY